MTEKRFKLRLSKLGNGMITDTQKREDLYFDKEFLDATLPKTNEWLNELADENEQLRHDATILIQSNQDYRRENEKLKKELQEMKDFYKDYKPMWETVSIKEVIE